MSLVCLRVSVAQWAIAGLTVAPACGRPPFGRARGLGLGGPAAQLPKNRRVHLPRICSSIAQANIAPHGWRLALDSIVMSSKNADGERRGLPDYGMTAIVGVVDMFTRYTYLTVV